MTDAIDKQIVAAEQRGHERFASEPRAERAWYEKASGRVIVELVNGCSYAFPARFVQDLADARPDDLSEVAVDGVGFNLHWPKLDVDLFVPALVAGIFGNRAWMSRELARMAGATKSPAKSAAARANGAKGGRPRKAAMA